MVGGVNLGGIAFIPSVGVGFPCLGVHFHDGFNFQYVALIPYDGTGIPDGDASELSVESANFQFTPMMDIVTRRIIWKHTGAIQIIGEDGSGQAVVRSGSPPAGQVFSPWWHPDGSKILYMAAIADQISSPDQIQTIEPDGSNQQTLYTAPSATAFLWPASYNVDGTRIAFAQKINSSTRQLKTMNADGSNLINAAVIGGISDRADSPAWAWFASDPDRLIANTGTAFSPVIKAMDYDGTNLVTLDSGTTRSLFRHFAVMEGDTHYITRKADQTFIQKVALDGSGVSNFIDTATPGAFPTANVFADSAPCANGRIYWDVGTDIWSALSDGTDLRNETPATPRNYGLTG